MYFLILSLSFSLSLSLSLSLSIYLSISLSIFFLTPTGLITTRNGINTRVLLLLATLFRISGSSGCNDSINRDQTPSIVAFLAIPRRNLYSKSRLLISLFDLIELYSSNRRRIVSAFIDLHITLPRCENRDLYYDLSKCAEIKAVETIRI